MIDKIKEKKTSYIFNFVAILVLVGSIIVYNLFQETKDKIDKINIKSNLDYIDDITSNISELILNSTNCDIYKTLQKNETLRKSLEKNLQLLVTKKYRYVYVVDKKNKNSKDFRFLLDGSKNPDDKSEFEEPYQPLNIKKWNSVYKTKKPIYFEHKDIKSLWLTYLKPIIVNNEVQAIIAIDFSLEDHKSIINSLNQLNDTFKILILFSIFIFVIIIFFSYLDNQRIKELREKSNKITKFNEVLKIKIKEEVEKNREKDKQIIQQSRLAQMGEMISMIAHQWRQPLSAISSASSAINIKARLNTLDNETAAKLSENISKFSQHLSSTIDDFRNFFKSNKERRNTTYNELVESALGIIESSITNKNIKIIKEFNSDKVIYTYPNEVKQVILNLLKNAEDILIEKRIKNPTIIIKTYDYTLEVIDNGGGVPEEIIDKIFDPYFSTKTKKDGTGLGLYMSKTIIEDHCEGKLEVENTKDGAIFRIVLNGSNV